MRIVTVTAGDELYEILMGPLRESPDLAAHMQADADSRLDEADRSGAKAWTMAVTDDLVAVAWSATVLTWTGGLPFAHCCNHYHRREYRQAYPNAWRDTLVARQRLIRLMAADAYVFDQPVPHMRALGWQLSGEDGWWRPDDGSPPCHWQRMLYTPV